MSRDEFNPHPVKRFIIESMARRLPSCDATTHTISESLDRPLTLKERILKRLHLMICIWCTRYSKQVELIRTAMKQRWEAPEEAPSLSESRLSEEALRKIRSAMEKGDAEG